MSSRGFEASAKLTLYLRRQKSSNSLPAFPVDSGTILPIIAQPDETFHPDGARQSQSATDFHSTDQMGLQNPAGKLEIQDPTESGKPFSFRPYNAERTITSDPWREQRPKPDAGTRIHIPHGRSMGNSPVFSLTPAFDPEATTGTERPFDFMQPCFGRTPERLESCFCSFGSANVPGWTCSIHSLGSVDTGMCHTDAHVPWTPARYRQGPGFTPDHSIRAAFSSLGTFLEGSSFFPSTQMSMAKSTLQSSLLPNVSHQNAAFLGPLQSLAHGANTQVAFSSFHEGATKDTNITIEDNVLTWDYRPESEILGPMPCDTNTQPTWPQQVAPSAESCPGPGSPYESPTRKSISSDSSTPFSSLGYPSKNSTPQVFLFDEDKG